MNAKNSEESFLCLSDSVKIQPVMDARGAVCEMALVGGGMERIFGDRPHDAAAEALRKAGRVFQASGCLVPLTMDHQLNVCSEIRLPEQLCQDLRIATVANDLLPQTGPGCTRLPIYPSAKVIYNVPLSGRLLDGADLFRHYHDFRVSLRIRLLPCNAGGAPTPFGVIRAVGVRIGIPAGIHHLHKLQERFFNLLGQASRKGLGMLVSDIQSMEDFNWLRMQPGVLFQGEVLSTALSLEYVQQWLTGAETDWRKFQLGGRETPVAALA
ncbi:hypothetical protein D3C86_740790 [compost metagenome]|jgi:hypothetical protein